jgi:hypothetical protein
VSDSRVPRRFATSVSPRAIARVEALGGSSRRSRVPLNSMETPTEATLRPWRPLPPWVGRAPTARASRRHSGTRDTPAGAARPVAPSAPPTPPALIYRSPCQFPGIIPPEILGMIPPLLGAAGGLGLRHRGHRGQGPAPSRPGRATAARPRRDVVILGSVVGHQEARKSGPAAGGLRPGAVSWEADEPERRAGGSCRPRW